MHTNRQVTNEKQIPIHSFMMLISIGSLHHKHLNCVHYPKSLNAQTLYAIALEIPNEWKEPRENLCAAWTRVCRAVHSNRSIRDNAHENCSVLSALHSAATAICRDDNWVSLTRHIHCANDRSKQQTFTWMWKASENNAIGFHRSNRHIQIKSILNGEEILFYAPSNGFPNN